VATRFEELSPQDGLERAAKTILAPALAARPSAATIDTLLSQLTASAGGRLAFRICDTARALLEDEWPVEDPKRHLSAVDYWANNGGDESALAARGVRAFLLARLGFDSSSSGATRWRHGVRLALEQVRAGDVRACEATLVAILRDVEEDA
jgi:hypothetical protein